ncbi:Chemotaxis protein CheA [bacterium HR40]|nr:Chemotaxis protein CheA [bacterium HR40]
MEDLIAEFTAECREGLARVDSELVAFERDPHDRERLGEIFRVVHTIKGTSGFLGLGRLERIAHAAETLLGTWRDGAPPTAEGMSVVLAAIDRIKDIVAELEGSGTEPSGDDAQLLERLERIASGSAPLPTRTEGTNEEQVSTSADADPAACAAWQTGGPPAAGDVAAVAGQPMRAAAEVAGGGDEDPRQEGGHRRAARSGSLRVSVALLEALMGHVSDLVLTRNRLVRLGRDLAHPELETALQRLDQVTTELRDGIMKARMQPISNAWSGMPRIVRDLCAALGKKVDLVMEGGATELDRQLLEVIKDPLVHIVRNAIDHGIEPPEERRRAGKPETGRLRLQAAHEGGMIVVRISDDGRGLDLERIGRKAVAAGLCTEARLATLSPRQIASFIFAPGLSTAEKVTNVSGRGVGMDVVKRNIEDIGGSVEIETQRGLGTTFTITIPLTLAIVPALIVGVADQRFALPQQGILEIVRCAGGDDRRLELINGRQILKLRGELLPVRTLAEILGIAGEGQDCLRNQGFVLVLEPAGHRFGLVVDAVHDSEEIVVEPISPVLRNITLFAGTTLLGDGAIAIVLDLKALASAIATDDRMAAEPEPHVGPQPDSERTRLLRFAAGRYRMAAVPIALVQRIERIEPQQLELVGTRSVFRFGNELVPLVDVDGRFVAGLDGPRPALLFADAGRRFALLVDEILDVVEAEVELTIDPDGPGSLGAGYFAGASCVLLDVSHYVSCVFGSWFGADRARKDRPRIRVLLVDDSRFFRSLLSPILANRGFEVVAAESAEEALRLLGEGERFDVVVSDLEMPGMDGFALAETCRARGLRLPLIALSSRAAPEDRSRSRAAGFDAHVAKLDRAQLFETVARLVGEQAARS